MTTTDTTVSNLIINTMTQAQYNQITPSDTELYLVTDSTITSSEVTSALGYTPTNTSLSNLSSTSSKNFDGQWVASRLTIDETKATHTSTANLGTTGTSPLSYLPSDCTTYDYLVIGSMSGTTTSNTPVGWVGNVTSPATATNGIYAVIVGDGSNRRPSIQFIIPVTNGMIYTQVSNAAFSNNFGVVLTGYRRIGTNA